MSKFGSALAAPKARKPRKAATVAEAAPDRVQVTWYVSQAEHRRLRLLAAEHGIPVQHMLDDGISLVLKKLGEPPLVAINRKATAARAQDDEDDTPQQPAPKTKPSAGHVERQNAPTKRKRGHAIPAYEQPE